MLIPYSTVVEVCNKNNINIRGILHLGAHECEELHTYVSNGVRPDRVVWIEGNKDLYDKMVGHGVPNMIHAVVDEESGREVNFNITNNGQSSSILELGTHSTHYPDIYFTHSVKSVTKTLKDVAKESIIDFSKLNFWNLDIQGAELRALKGAGELLNFVDALYLEVNTEKVYKECALMSEIDEYVRPLGFHRVITNMTTCGWGDALYIKT